MSADTIVPSPGNPQSLNRYSYVLNNALKYTDPTGHYAFEEDPDDPVSYGTNVRSKYIRTHPEYDERDITGEEILFDAAAPLWTSGGVVGSIAAVEGVPIGVAVARDALYKIAVQLSAACMLNDLCARTIYGVTSNSATSGQLTVVEGGSYSESELNAAREMAKRGFDVMLRPPVGTRVGGGTSDLLVNGVRYDVYTPVTANPDRIISFIAHKNLQAEGVIVDLSKTTVTAAQLGNVLARVQGAGGTNIKDIIILGGR